MGKKLSTQIETNFYSNRGGVKLLPKMQSTTAKALNIIRQNESLMFSEYSKKIDEHLADTKLLTQTKVICQKMRDLTWVVSKSKYSNHCDGIQVDINTI